MEQDEIRKAAKAWVEKPNEANVERMRQESGHTATYDQETELAPDLIWQALADCEIMLTTDKLNY